MTKEQWLESWKEFFNNHKEPYTEQANEVLKFIANVLYYNEESETIYNLFGCGYCYYFALMLKDAFSRGEICWHKGYSHIVWLDTNNIAYDIGGIFQDYKDVKYVGGEKDDLVPISELSKQELSYFKHTT